MRKFILYAVTLSDIVSDKHFWRNAFVLKSGNEDENVPHFLAGVVKDIFICGKSLCLLKLCNPQVRIFSRSSK